MKVYLVWKVVNVGDEYLLKVFSNEDSASYFAQKENERCADDNCYVSECEVDE